MFYNLYKTDIGSVFDAKLIVFSVVGVLAVFLMGYFAVLIFTKDNMKTIDLATNVFGQSFNCTMVQMASAVASLINGGHYYTPHVVAKITDDAGNTISTVQPELVKQTVSQSTSDLLRKYMYSVVSSGTGKVAKVDGYSMGGKTGTAQKAARDKNYLLSFIGFAPYENPELLIYCVIDEPNMEDQSHSSYAQNVVREILEEVLPYLNIYPDEELTGINKKLDIAGNPVEETEQEPEIEDEPEEALEPEAEDKPEGEALEPEAEDKPEGEASEPEAEDKPEDEESEA